MIRVLVVEDSAVVREFLLGILRTDPKLEVIGTARSGEEALAAAERMKPDVMTMDVHMPGIDGFEATRRIMETRPIPIVIVSGTTDVRETANAFRAVEAGALALLARPAGIGHPDHQRTAAELVQTVKWMSEVKLVRRWPRRVSKDNGAATFPAGLPGPASTAALIAMGASTGGPGVLQAILSQLPRNFPAALLLVQHIATGFTTGFAEWLGHSSNLPVRVAANGEPILPGQVYLAPEGLHMKVHPGGTIGLSDEEPENGLRPSISVLFRSVSELYGREAVGVLLTGMGKDGAWELKLMKDRGAVTIAQDRESSVVHGMPGEAIRVGAATYVLPSEKIAAALLSLVTAVGGNDRKPVFQQNDRAGPALLP
jgi:two-component system, chemotaxis family, protein-glutamate methylesterase/glutaminase